MTQFEPLERLRFFPGKLLSADDFQQEQEYFLERLHRHNRLMHGWGIVSGLNASISGGTTVTVEPGYAIDCAGHEIVLDTAQALPVAGLPERQYVAVRYTELLVGETPTANGVESSRVREAAVVELLDANPGVGHRGLGPGTPGCGKSHALCLATIAKHGVRWRIVSHHHRRS